MKIFQQNLKTVKKRITHLEPPPQENGKLINLSNFYLKMLRIWTFKKNKLQR